MPWSQSVPVGNDGGPAGQAELEQLKHAAKIGVRRSFANLSPRIRIHNQLAIPGGIPWGGQGRRPLSGLFAHRPHLLTGRVRLS
jgi:hypothetical protein